MARNPALTGILFAAGGTIIFSVNDVAIKFLSGGYALHQVILIRAFVAMAFILAFIAFSGTGFAQLRTRRPKTHLLRVAIVMVSNVTFFLGLAALPLADAVAVAFVSPIAITVLSVLFLKETVGPRRWAAVILGMIGVLIMLRPGAGVIQPAAILVLISAILYAAGNLLARQMGGTESAMTLGFFVQAGFIIVSVAMGLWVGDGHLATDDKIWAFLFRPWIWPPVADWPIFLATGLAVGIGGMMVTQAYRTAEAGLVAPFEYVGMPAAIIWGAVVFGTFPDLTAWAGIALICGSGLYTLWRETARKKEAHAA
ncbi:MAG: DMT family transporter [Tabrizicola sp.]|uniref:DMT family transporter n=1 Tax=Tabrizicola sp. TaxID=2005166 RepID=UPI002736906C|nr:DMT family transporter [Tabrizicola sp.]MDP3262112.1 DMT family transporter [Tabrizicola sp.]MDP3648142.1 DMT family transporter [Paracoccaceae bacterium]MDZ4066063.1 DMT family transporter [Tabrizicola sp.]